MMNETMKAVYLNAFNFNFIQKDNKISLKPKKWGDILWTDWYIINKKGFIEYNAERLK
jgi:hypothetical protein